MLTLTTSVARCVEIVAKLGVGSAALLFKAAEGNSLKVPVPDLLAEPWMRAGHAPLCIAKAL